MFSSILEYIYSCISFAWNTPLGKPYNYKDFSYGLMAFLEVYNFLYNRDDKTDKMLESENKEIKP